MIAMKDGGQLAVSPQQSFLDPAALPAIFQEPTCQSADSFPDRGK
jgi:hypothetical protein